LAASGKNNSNPNAMMMAIRMVMTARAHADMGLLSVDAELSDDHDTT
jgi:hypothetical protein